MIQAQAEMDYIQAAYMRTASDTQVLEKKASLTIPANSSSVVLPDEVIQLEGIFNGTWALTLLPVIEYMRLASGTPVIVNESSVGQFFCVIGRTLYVWPSVGTASTLTAFYTYRPKPLTSDKLFEFTGYPRRLVERLVAAYVLWDDGQPELAQAELTQYVKDAKRFMRRNTRREGTGGQLQLAGKRRAPG